MNKILEEDFIARLPGDTIEASRFIVKRFRQWERKRHASNAMVFNKSGELGEEDYQGLLDFLGFLKSFIEIHQLKIEVGKPVRDKQKDYSLGGAKGVMP